MQKQNNPFIIENDDKWQFESRTICSRVEEQDLNWVYIFSLLDYSHQLLHARINNN